MAEVENHNHQQGNRIKIQTYKSTTSEQTTAEIQSRRIVPTRNLFRMQIKKKRKDFNQPYKFMDNQLLNPLQFPAFKQDFLGLVKKMVVQIGLQGSGPYTSTSSQTFFKAKINKCLQIDSRDDEPEIKAKDEDLMTFLENVYPEMQAALQSNQTLDIFQDDFDVLPQTQRGSKQNAQISNVIKQTKNLFYLPCKGKKVSCIQFQPWVGVNKGKNPIVAESFVQNLTFDERVIFSMKSSKSTILLWNYQDLHAIDPLLILVSPLEVLTFQFNPKDPTIVIAGTINGQIIMWDLKNIQIGHHSAGKKKNKSSQKRNIRQIQPAIMSALQDPSSIQPVSDAIKRNIPSHKSPVLCIKWFPSSLEIDIRKSFSALVPNTTGEINQFASISSDGQVLLWEKKFLDAQKKPVTDLSQFSWKAGYGFHLFRPEGGGQLGGSSIAFKKNQKRTVFMGASDQGQLFVCDWSARSADQAGSKNQTIIGFWNQQRSFRPVVSLDLLPSNDDIMLTVYDFHFCIWKTNVQVPLFTSLITKGCFHTAGCWSPSRAGVLFIGKSNGTIDIWDFMDQSHKWTMQYSVGSVGIASMKFHEYNPNILAVGSQDGSLHILQLPFTLVRKIGDEDRTMNEFWNRQIQSVKYFIRRFEIRYEQSQHERAIRDQQQRQKAQKQEKKQKREDEQNQVNAQYLQFSKKYLNQVIYGLPPEQKQQKQQKQKKVGRK